ncbi:MAG: hypothetical protein ACJA0U_000787 [Salibacteraceae bacterium]|jgi:hypothetical protein
MKEIILVVLIVICACSGPESIDVNSLDTAFDHVVAIEEVCDEILNYGDDETLRDLKGSELQEAKALLSKLGEIHESMQTSYNFTVYSKCERYEEVMDKMSDIQ